MIKFVSFIVGEISSQIIQRGDKLLKRYIFAHVGLIVNPVRCFIDCI